MKKTATPSAAAHITDAKAGAHRRRRALNGRGPAPLALEPRVMFDGATGDAVLAAKAAAERTAAAQVAERSAAADAGRSGVERMLQAAPAVAAQGQRHEIVFIEDSVKDYQQIAAGVQPGVEVVILDHTKDGLQQMLAALDGHAPVDAIHLVTHGGEAAIDLGATRVDEANLDSYSAQFAQLGASLADGGDLLIYGCDVAAGADGHDFVNRIAAMTSADVAASVDITGSAAFHGNSVLEDHVGTITTRTLDFEHYDGDLSVQTVTAPAAGATVGNTITFSGTTSNNSSSVQVTIIDSHSTQLKTTLTVGSQKTFSQAVDISTLANGQLTVYFLQSSSGTASSTTNDGNTLTLTKAGVNGVPTATPQTVGATEDTPITVTLAGTDPENSALTYNVASMPAYGALYQVNSDGSRGAQITSAGTLVSNSLHQVWFEPAANDNGSGHGNFTFTVNDGQATSPAGAVTVNIAAVNDAPVATGNAALASITDSAASVPGATVSSLFASRFTDVDTGDTLAGIAIVGYTRSAGAGDWQYYNGTSWVSISSSVTSASSAITFKATDQLRFMPASGFSGAAPALTVKLIDSGRTVTTNGTVDASVSGGTSDFSNSVQLTTSVTKTFTLSSPDSSFVALLSGSNYDPFNDTQSHAADTDLVGDANNPMLLGGYDSTSGNLYYRVRIGNPTLSKGTPVFSGVVLLGLDVNGDGKLDVFIGVDGRNNGLGVVTFAAGNDLNVSPSTTSITAPQATGGSYSYLPVTTATTDIGGDGKTDAYLTFSLPFSALAARVAALNKGTITTSTPLGFVVLTMTQNNSINGDIGGLGGMTKAMKDTSWTDLGILKSISLTAPTLGGISGNIQYVENGAGVALAPNATFSDFDSKNFSGGKLEVTITANADSGKDVLSLSANGVTASNGVVSVGGTQVGSYSFASNVLTVNFTAANVTSDQVTAVVRAVSFSNTSDAPSTVNRAVQFKVTDADSNANNPALAAVAVLVQAVDDAPVVAGTSTALNRSVVASTTYSVASATASDALILATGTNSNLSISDVDAGSGVVRATLGVTTGVLELYSNGSLVTGSVTIDGVTFTGSRTGSLVMTGTISSINAILAGTNASAIKVLYQSGLSQPSSATLSLSVNDQGNTGTGGPLTASSTVGTISIGAAAPTGPVTGSVTEDLNVSGGNLTASGTLSQNITAATFAANTLGTGALGTLGFSAGSGTWTYTVSNSNSTVQALANGQSIEESFKVDTAGGSVYVRVTINGVNDAPTLTVTNGAGGYTEGSTAATLFTGATATFGAGESMQAISNMTLDVTNVFDGDQIIIDGTKLYIDQPSSGTLTTSGYSVNVSFSAGTATLSINTGQSSASAIQSLVTGLAYQSASRNPTNYGANTSRTFTIRSLQDTGGTANGGSDTASLSLSRTVTVTPVNDPPALNTAPVTLNQNSTITLDSSFLLANDPDTAPTSLIYTVTGLPGKGTIKVNGVAASSFTQQDVNDGKVTYTAAASGSTTTDSFNVSVTDGTTPVAGSVAVSIITTNYAPTSADNSVVTLEDTSYVFGSADFAFSDFNTGDSMSQVEVFTLPGAGKLQTLVNGTWQDVTAAHTLVTAADVAAGHLKFVPVANGNGSPYTSFTFKVYDQSNAASAETLMTIGVTPVNDAPVAANDSIATSQGVAKTGQLPTATDVDNDTVTYAKGSDPANGTVTVGANGAYTYTPNSNFSGSDSFTYTINDGHGGSNTYTVSVTVTPTAPPADTTAPVVTANQAFTYPENRPADAIIGTVAATDNVGVTGFRFADTQGATNATGYFAIDSSGKITMTAAGAASDQNDYEKISGVIVNVQARDAAGNWSASQSVTLNVSNIDEVAPAITSSATANAAENQNLLYTAQATDLVDFTDKVVTYSLAAGGDAAALQINSSTGAVTLATGTLDYETKVSYTFTVIAKDATGNQSTKAVTVSVTNIDEVAPAITSSATASAAVNQNLLYTAQATDVVDFTDKVVTYSLAAGGDAASLNIDRSTGAVTLASGNLDSHVKSSYSFTVVAADATGNQSTKSVTVTVTTVDAVAPAFTSAATASVSENQNVLYTAVATDNVAFTDHVVSYSLAAGGDAAALSIDSSTGVVKLASGNLDYETKASYTFTVIAKDATGNQSTKAVTVAVTNIDEVAPAITSSATASAAENQNLLYTAQATDLVDFTDKVVTYSLAAGGDAASLNINPSTGAVTLAAGNLDYETKASYTFTVIAKDATGNQSTKAVTVAVTNIDEVAPAITSSATANAVEKQNLLYTAQATDLVDFTDKVVTYSLATGGDGAALHIDSASGAVTLASGNLDSHAKSSYTFTVVAADATGNQSTKTVTVAVTSNDAVAPAFTSAATASVPENQNVLYTAVATDNVEFTDHAVSYSLAAGGDAAALSIDSSTGLVKLASGNLDYETKASYAFTVIAKDATGNQSTKAVTVSVTNIDEVAPAITSSATANAAENQNLLYTAQATDLVDFTDKVVTYSLAAGGDAAALQINSSTGAVTLATGTLDYETKASYTFTVIAKDATGNQSTKAVTVSVTNIDEVAPAITSSATANAAENQNLLYTAQATDLVDFTDKVVTYSLATGGDAAALHIDSSTGAVTLASGNLDYETKASYTFTVIAKDATGNQSTKAVTVTVTNIDEVAPAITSSATANAAENQNLLYTAQATDVVDFTDKVVTYSLAAGGDAAALQINSSTGAVTLATGTLDYETKASYTFTVIAKDATGNQSTKAVTVSVTNIDEVAPAITSSATANAAEDQNLLYTAQATDVVDFTDKVVTYSLAAGGDAASLSINPSTGAVTLTTGNLDYETKASYTFTVIAKDATGNQSTKAVTVAVTNIDEVAPAITSSATASAVERQNLLYTVQATDVVDFTDKVVTYSLAAGGDAASLNIDRSSGAVTLASGNLDSHAKSSYSFTVVAADATGNQSTKSVTVTVTTVDAVAPAFTSAATASVNENQNVLYTAVAADNVEFTDHVVTYSLAAGGDAAALSIDSSTGVVKLASGNLDYETKASYAFTVIAKDATGNQSTKAVTVSVTNIDEVAPAITSSATANAAENQSLLYTAQATDVVDFTDKVVTYSLAAGGDAASLSINPSTGAVTLATGNLDYETKASYTFTVIAKDATGNQSSKAVTVSVTNIDEVAPTITSSATASAVEKQNLLYTAQATDLVDFTDKVVTYSLATGGDGAALHIDSASGAVTLASGNLDSHAKSSYTFTVVAADASGNQSTKTVTVAVTSNDAVAPAFTSAATASVPENQNVLYTAVATDNVEFTDHAVSYSLAAGGDAAALSIDSSTGLVKLASGNLDYETKASYTFTVIAKDASGNQRAQAVTVAVTNIDEVAPAFISSATVNAIEKQNLLYTARATDLVDFTDKVVTYSLAATGDASALQIDRNTGAVTLASGNLDVHARSSYTFTIVASDATGNQSTKDVTVTVTSNDVVAPSFTSAASASVPENQNVLYTAAATDNVEFTDHVVSYSLAAGGDAAALHIDASTGVVTLASGNLDYETKASYTFTVIAKDATGNQSTKAVAVSVANIDEVAPAFTSAASASVPENQNVLYTAAATDNVDFTDKAVTYSLQSGGDAAALHIDSATGVVTLASGNLDFETKQAYTFTVIASDATGNQSTKAVTVAVTNIDEVAPAFTSASAATASERQNVLYTAQASDNADFTDKVVTYALQAGGDAAVLHIDASTGVVTLASGNLDFTAKSSYSFTVIASDATGNQSTRAVTVAVANGNQVPVAADTAITTNQDTDKSGSLPAATDANGDAITYAKASDPANGSVTVNADGSYIYKPNASFKGADSFTYSVSDGRGSNTYTVAVTVAPVNHAPAAANMTISTPEEKSISGRLPAAADPDGDSVSYAKASGAAHGTVVVNADGTYSYTPAANYFGADSFSYSVSDGKGGSNTYTVSVVVAAVNHAPVGSAASATTAEDTPLSGSLPAATDRDGDAVSYALGSGAAHGTVAVGADGKFTYTPARDYNGSDSFTYVISDGRGGSATYTVSLDVTPVNDAPVGHGGADGAGTVGDPMPPVSVPAFTDVDSPTITYSATLANGGPLPGWLSFDPATRTFGGTPPAGSAGTLALKVTGSDGQLSDSVAVTITVKNPPAPSQSVSIASMSKDTGASASDFITNDGSAGRSVSGGLSAALGKNEVVQVSFDGGASWTTASVSGTSWSAVDGGAHGGNWTIVARVANTITNLNGGTASRDVVLDTTPPAAPTVDSQTTSSTTPTLTGSAQVAPGEILRISVNGRTYEVTATGGSWSLNLAASGAPLVPGQSYDVAATITDVAGNTRTANGTVAVSVPVVQQPKPDPAPQPTPAPVPVQPAPAPTPGAGGETPASPVAPSNPAGPASPAAPSSSVDTPAAPGSQVGGDAVRIVSGQGARPADTSLELQITRSAELSDVYTRSEGFRTVVAPAQEPALVLFQGVPDQFVESGTHLSLSVPADAFAHTQPKAIVRLAAQLQDGRPLPSWITFNGQTGQFTGDAPPGLRGELRIKVIARDMDGREAVALFRVNVGQGRMAGETRAPTGKPGLSQQLRTAGQRPSAIKVPQPQT